MFHKIPKTFCYTSKSDFMLHPHFQHKSTISHLIGKNNLFSFQMIIFSSQKKPFSKIEFIPSLNELQVFWYRLASAHCVKQRQIDLLSLEDHMSFEHILLPHEISGMYFISIFILI